MRTVSSLREGLKIQARLTDPIDESQVSERELYKDWSYQYLEVHEVERLLREGKKISEFVFQVGRWRMRRIHSTFEVSMWR